MDQVSQEPSIFYELSRITESNDVKITVALSENVTFSAVHPRHPASFEAQVAVSVLIAILGLWSTLGNLLTILAISIHPDIQIKCNYFICSLAISDLASGLLASPLWLYRRTWGFQEWNWGQFLCKLFWFVDESTSYCTAMHIASFAVWRYMGVKWPYSHERINQRAVKLWIFAIWVTALIFGGAIFCSFYSVEERHPGDDYAKWPACSITTANNGVQYHLVYYTFSSSCFMLLPMVILFVFSLLIIRELFCRRKIKSSSRQKKEKKAVCQLALISSSFLVGYVPMTSYVMWTTRRRGGDYRLDYWIHMLSYFCLRMSECINPVVYNVACRRMRQSSFKVLHFLKNRCRSDAEVEFLSHSPACNHRRLIRSPRHIVPREAVGMSAIKKTTRGCICTLNQNNLMEKHCTPV